MDKKLLGAVLAPLALWLACFTGTASADILIGQTAGLTGPTAGAMKEINEGADLYIEAVNRKGGVQGVPIKIIRMDDKFDPKLAAQNAQSLIEKDKVIALFLSRGTSQTEALLPVLAANETVLIGPSTGAMSLHEPVNPYVFNVRAPYQNEASKGIAQLHSTGLTKIAVIYRDDGFGKDGLTGAQKGFSLAGLQPLFVEKVDKVKADFAPAIAKAKAQNPQAIMIIEAPGTVARGVNEMRAAGVFSQIIALSNCASKGFIDAMGANARGVIVTQVFPSERTNAAPLISELRTLAKINKMEVSPSTVEGFAAAKVLVEALRRIKLTPSRANLLVALEGLTNFDVGGLPLTFSRTDHTGLNFTDLSIIDSAGQFRR